MTPRRAFLLKRKVYLVTLFAEQASIAIRNAQLNEAAQRGVGRTQAGQKRDSSAISETPLRSTE